MTENRICAWILIFLHSDSTVEDVLSNLQDINSINNTGWNIVRADKIHGMHALMAPADVQSDDYFKTLTSQIKDVPGVYQILVLQVEEHHLPAPPPQSKEFIKKDPTGVGQNAWG